MGLLNEFSTGLFIWQTILFIVLIFFLRKMAWKPILKAVNDREESIESAIKAAEKAREDMKNLQADNEKIMREAREERESILKEAREIRDNMISEAKNTAIAEAEKVTEAAKAQIENEKLAAIHEMKNQVAELSLQIAEKVLRQELKGEAEHKELIAASIKEAKLN
ncbi:MAG: F0F1 ATP synthase subunit B [Schleiferiaceae bacterium]|jgi:F-type H+-transporting ATPase subunit b|nr:F0F1 ATP synthase subunit B [Schleiferiaceae bacterium]